MYLGNIEELKEKFPNYRNTDTFTGMIARVVHGLKVNGNELERISYWLIELYERRTLAAKDYLQKKYPLLGEEDIHKMTEEYLNRNAMSEFDKDSDLYDEEKTEKYYEERGWK